MEHYRDVIMSTMASQIASVSIVYSTVCSCRGQRKHQSSASLAFVRGSHRWIPLHKGSWCEKCFYLITSSWSCDLLVSLAHEVTMKKVVGKVEQAQTPDKIPPSASRVPNLWTELYFLTLLLPKPWDNCNCWMKCGLWIMSRMGWFANNCHEWHTTSDEQSSFTAGHMLFYFFIHLKLFWKTGSCHCCLRWVSRLLYCDVTQTRIVTTFWAIVLETFIRTAVIKLITFCSFSGQIYSVITG